MQANSAQQAFSGGYGGVSAPPPQANYNLPQQPPQLPPPQASAAYGSAPYQQQYQQQPQFSAQFAAAQQAAQYGQQPIYQTPEALQQTQSQTGFNPQQPPPVYANNFPGGYPGQQQGYPQQGY